MRCDQFESRMNDLLDARLEPEQDRALQEHARQCPACESLLATQSWVFSCLADDADGQDFADESQSIASQSIASIKPLLDSASASSTACGGSLERSAASVGGGTGTVGWTRRVWARVSRFGPISLAAGLATVVVWMGAAVHWRAQRDSLDDRNRSAAETQVASVSGSASRAAPVRSRWDSLVMVGRRPGVRASGRVANGRSPLTSPGQVANGAAAPSSADSAEAQKAEEFVATLFAAGVIDEPWMTQLLETLRTLPTDRFEGVDRFAEGIWPVAESVSEAVQALIRSGTGGRRGDEQRGRLDTSLVDDRRWVV